MPLDANSGVSWSTYCWTNPALTSLRTSEASDSKWIKRSDLPRPTAWPTCLRSSISWGRNREGMRTERSNPLPFSDRTSTVYFRAPMCASAFP